MELPVKKHNPARHRRLRLVGLLGATTLLGTLACSRGVERAPVPGEVVVPVPETPPSEVRTLPDWVEHPQLHPRFPSTEVIGAVGSSRLGPVDAENDALDALVDALVARVEAARARAVPLHPYFAHHAEFADAVDRRLEPSSPLVAGVFGTARVDSASRIVYRDVDYAFAYVDRETAIAELERRGGHMTRRVDEAIDIAMNAADIDNWFGFVRWSRSALVREADRVATLVLRDALGDRVPLDNFERSRRLEWIGVVADTLSANHGWTLHTEFEWDEPPPPQMEVRVKRHLMDLLRRHGLRAGFGTGCPKAPPRPVTEWPEIVTEAAEDDTTDVDVVGGEGTGAGEDEASEDELEEPAPHHVLSIRASGSATRKALASWDALVVLTVEARTCDAGPMVAERSLGELEGRSGRDAQAAYLRALDWQRMDELLLDRLREIDLLPPVELVEAAPQALRAF
jgi:hypothetical protein